MSRAMYIFALFVALQLYLTISNIPAMCIYTIKQGSLIWVSKKVASTQRLLLFIHFKIGYEIDRYIYNSEKKKLALQFDQKVC